MAEYFYMGGYGAFVWPAYIAVLAVLAGLGIQSRKLLAGLERDVDNMRSVEIAGSPEDEIIEL